MNIHSFSPGDRITRSEPAIFRQSVHNSTLGIDEETDELVFDEIGEKLLLLDVKHNCIYLEGDGYNVKFNIHKKNPVDFTQGWEYYSGPEFVEEIDTANTDKPPKIYKNWFKAGSILASIAMFIICFSDISAVFFYSYLAVFFASALSFVYYITKTDQ